MAVLQWKVNIPPLTPIRPPTCAERPLYPNPNPGPSNAHINAPPYGRAPQHSSPYSSWFSPNSASALTGFDLVAASDYQHQLETPREIPEVYMQLREANVALRAENAALKFTLERVTGFAASHHAPPAPITQHGALEDESLMPLRRGDFPSVTYWHLKDWTQRVTDVTEHTKKKRKDKDDDMATNSDSDSDTDTDKVATVARTAYIQNDDGSPLHPDTDEKMHTKFRETLEALTIDQGLRPQTWGSVPVDIKKKYFKVMREAFPQLALCSYDWKANNLAVIAYPSFIRACSGRKRKQPGTDIAPSSKKARKQRRSTTRTTNASTPPPAPSMVSTSTTISEQPDPEHTTSLLSSAMHHDAILPSTAHVDDNCGPAPLFAARVNHTADSTVIARDSSPSVQSPVLMEPVLPTEPVEPTEPAHAITPVFQANPLIDIEYQPNNMSLTQPGDDVLATTQINDHPTRLGSEAAGSPAPAADAALSPAPTNHAMESLDQSSTAIESTPQAITNTAATSATLRQRKSPGKLYQPGPTITPRNLCGRDWVMRTPNGTVATFNTYWSKTLLDAEREHWEQVAKEKKSQKATNTDKSVA